MAIIAVNYEVALNNVYTTSREQGEVLSWLRSSPSRTFLNAFPISFEGTTAAAASALQVFAERNIIN
jgi:hypothetical protein